MQEAKVTIAVETENHSYKKNRLLAGSKLAKKELVRISAILRPQP